MNKPIIRVFAVLLVLFGLLAYFTTRWTVIDRAALAESLEEAVEARRDDRFVSASIHVSDGSGSYAQATSHGFADYYDFVQYDEDGPVKVEGYYTDYVGEKAVEYAGELAGGGAPFFMWVSHFAPHPARERATCESEVCGVAPPRPSPRASLRRSGPPCSHYALQPLCLAAVTSWSPWRVARRF